MEESEKQRKLYVGGLSWVTTEDDLKEHFSKYGTVVSAVIARDRNTGAPRGFAFVYFIDPSAVAKALQEHTHNILGRTVDVKRAMTRGEQNEIQLQQSRSLSINSRSNGRSNVQSRTKKIFVGGLSADLTEDEFKSYFEQFGRITDVVVMHNNVTLRPRGFGFITFDSDDAVEDVMLKSFHELGGKHVEVKKAVPKDLNNSGYNGLMGSGRVSNCNSYQDGNFQSYYSPRYDLFQGYGHHPGYGPLSGYGVVGGYPYGAGIVSGGYPTGYGGIGFGMTQVAPRSPWTVPMMNGVWGSPLPYTGAANFYSSYMNGSIGATGVAANVYNGIMGTVSNGKSSQRVITDAQLAADRTSSQIDQKKISVKSMDSDGSNGDVASKGSELKAYSDSNSS